jgi:hypothetical protein
MERGRFVAVGSSDEVPMPCRFGRTSAVEASFLAEPAHAACVLQFKRPS